MELRGIDCRHRSVVQGSKKKTELETFASPPQSVDSATSLDGTAEPVLAAGQTAVEVESLLAEPQSEVGAV